MGVKSNINQFLKDTDKEIEKQLKKQERFGKSVILEALRSINNLSPVDTAYFKSNNFITYNGSQGRASKFFSDLFSKKQVKEKGYYSSKAQKVLNTNRQTLVGKNLFNVKSVVIQNNTVYSSQIEGGRSKQAPRGVYGITEERIRSLLNAKI